MWRRHSCLCRSLVGFFQPRGRNMFSNRAHWNATTNRLTVARLAYRGTLLDLTNANPTTAGLAYPLDELSEVMARAARAPYDPPPLGLASAREAVARELA